MLFRSISFSFKSRLSVCGSIYGFSSRFDLRVKAKPRTDIRIRSRRRVIRIRIHEPRIRTIIRITAEQNTTTSDNHYFFFLSNPVYRFAGRFTAFQAASICGSKQSREPKYARADVGVLDEYAHTNPAAAPSAAPPPNKTPHSNSPDAGMSV